MAAITTYSTGTVSVANGATTIVGAGGANWSNPNVKPGDSIVIAGNTVTVLDVTDATHLVILPWPFTTVSAGTAYTILQTSTRRSAGGDAMEDVAAVFSGLRTKGLYIFVDPDATAPDPSLGREDQFALQPDTGKLWLKTGGVWVFQGIYKGLSPKGPWDSGTAYNIGDIVSLAGTSYLALAISTNQTPPNATYWQVLAAKGDTGSTGPQGASYGGTSTTSLAIGTGSKTFNGVGTGLAYQVGNYVRASSSANGANFMEGVVTAYSSGNITLNVTRVGGSGTLASWNLSISGAPGSGDLLSTNNLSDVANAATARANLGIIPTPQGRLTLQTGVPVMTTTQTAKTTIYYTPYVGNQIPIYDGTKMVPTVFAEISVATTDTTKNPAALAANKVNDWFIWNDSGTLRLSHGPDWTNDTTRSAGTALTMVNGILLNNASITNGPAAQRGTYVGTTKNDANGQLDWIFGGSASGGTAAFLWVWNAYNRVDVTTAVTDSGNWTTSTSATPAALDAGGTGSGLNNRINAVFGLAEDGISISIGARLNTAVAASAFGSVGFALDAANVMDKRILFVSVGSSSVNMAASIGHSYAPQIGAHFWQATQAGDGTNSCGITFGVDGSFSGRFRM